MTYLSRRLNIFGTETVHYYTRSWKNSTHFSLLYFPCILYTYKTSNFSWKEEIRDDTLFTHDDCFYSDCATCVRTSWGSNPSTVVVGGIKDT